MMGRLSERKKRVARLAERAGEHKRKALRHRQQIRAWQRDHLARLDTLAWIYAAGVTWGVSRPSAAAPTAHRGNTLRLVNAALVATRMIGTAAPDGVTADEIANG